MLHTRYTFGALVVVLDDATGRVVAVLHSLSDPMRNASELFSDAYINAAVNNWLVDGSVDISTEGLGIERYAA